MDLETITQSEREKQVSYTNTYMDSGKMVQMNLPAGQEQKHRRTERTRGHTGGRGR